MSDGLSCSHSDTRGSRDNLSRKLKDTFLYATKNRAFLRIILIQRKDACLTVQRPHWSYSLAEVAQGGCGSPAPACSHRENREEKGYCEMTSAFTASAQKSEVGHSECISREYKRSRSLVCPCSQALITNFSGLS